MTAIEIIRAVLAKHTGDYDHRGHMPGCSGFMHRSPVERYPCTALCREARRILDEGDLVQLKLGVNQ